MPRIFHTLDKIKPAYEITEKIVMLICKLLLIADIAVTTYTVMGRYCQQMAIKFPAVLGWMKAIKDPAWSEEVILSFMAYMAVLAAAIAIRRGAHIRMTALDRYLPKTLIKVLDILADVGVCALAVIMVVEGWTYAVTLGARGAYVSMPWLSRFWMYLPVPLAGVAMIVFEIECIYNHIKAFFIEEEKEAEA